MAPSKRYDLDRLKFLAAGRWSELLGLFGDVVNPKIHQPCPKCGGTKRFRVFDDFPNTGGLICNDCPIKSPDGIESYAWLYGIPKAQAISTLAEKLGLDAIEATPGPKKSTRKGDSSTGSKSSADPPSTPTSPEDRFKWLDWNESLVALFCLRKPGILAISLVEIGAKIGTHYGTTVIALPVRDARGATLGYLAANATGGKMVIEHKDKSDPPKVTDIETMSWKNVFPSGCDGIVATPNLFDSEARAKLTRIYKTEGPSDLLALMPLLQPGEGAWCNAAGAGENPEKFGWVLDWFAGKQVVVIHDRDTAGVEGALGSKDSHKPGFAGWAARKARECRNVELPYPLAEKQGKDLRDWIAGGGDALALHKLIESAPIIPAAREFREITNYVLNFVTTKEGKEKAIKIPKRVRSIIAEVVKEFDGWPKCVDGTLFHHDKSVRYFPTQPALFGWLREKRIVRWAQGEELATKDEFFCALKQNVEQVSELQNYPHFPPIQGMYYTCNQSPTPGDGKAVEGFLDFFSPDHPLDRQLMMACLMTVFWGGQPGQRPGWLITSPLRQGAGKSSFSEKIAALVGGLFDFNPKTDPDKDKTRLLSKEGLNKRVARYDNIKAVRFSLSTLESLITSEAVSGHRMYQGEGSRANYLTWFITMNDPELSRDLAQRCVSVSLGAPKRDGDWTAAVNKYIKDNGAAIIQDVAAFYQRPIRRTIKVNRWGSWVVEVLCRLDNPQEVFDLIEEREKANDSDSVAAEEVNEYVHHKMKQLGYHHPSVVHIPNQILARWANNAIGNEQRQAAVLKQLKQMADSGLLSELEINPSRKNGRGWIFRSGGWADSQTDYDIEKRIAEREKSLREKYGEKNSGEKNNSDADFDF